MSKQNKLINKVKHLLRKTKQPKYLHKFGPKTYELWQHILALFVKQYCCLSYRGTTQFLRDMGFKVATKSTLQRYSNKLNLVFWKSMLKLTLGKITNLAAIDGTGLERTKASWHYVKRIQSYRHKTGYHLSILSTHNNKILSLRLRSKICHDVKDVKYLWRNAPRKPNIILMDKGYDCEWIHEFFNEKGVKSIAPLRKNARKGFYRRKLMRDFPRKLYNKRGVVESTIHALKQKYGASVNSKHIGPARTEVYCRAILHNLFLIINQVLGQTCFNDKIYIGLIQVN